MYCLSLQSTNSAGIVQTPVAQGPQASEKDNQKVAQIEQKLSFAEQEKKRLQNVCACVYPRCAVWW